MNTVTVGILRRSSQVLIAVGSLALSWPQLAGGNGVTVCANDVLDSGTYANIVVGEGTTCTLSGIVVEGNIRAHQSADLTISNVVIDGNVSIWRTTGDISINGAQVDGNVSVVGVSSTFLEIANSQIDGNVRLRNNQITGSLFDGEGILFFRPNIVNGNVFLLENSAGSLLGIGSCNSGGNTIKGNARLIGNTANVAAFLNCNDIDGNAALVGNTVMGGVVPSDEDVQATGNMIGGNLHVINNTAPDQVAVGDVTADPGQPVLFPNTIAGNLICLGNDPDPTTEASDPTDFASVELGNEVGGIVNCAD